MKLYTTLRSQTSLGWFLARARQLGRACLGTITRAEGDTTLLFVLERGIGTQNVLFRAPPADTLHSANHLMAGCLPYIGILEWLSLGPPASATAGPPRLKGPLPLMSRAVGAPSSAAAAGRHRSEPRLPLTNLCASGLRQSISLFCAPAGLVMLPKCRPTSHPRVRAADLLPFAQAEGSQRGHIP